MAMLKSPFKQTDHSKEAKHTTIKIHYDVGFNNHLSIRGNGANLSWEKGKMLHNVKHNEWIWETDVPFNSCEFKVLINDKEYESGENHKIICGEKIEYTPHF